MVNGCFLLLHHHCLFGLFEVSTVGADVLLTWKSAVFMDGINRCFASNASKVALFFLGCGVISRL
jgi:hypothetical protein